MVPLGLKTGTVARCSNCESLFHAKCLLARGHSRSVSTGSGKWWAELTEGSKTFMCPLVSERSIPRLCSLAVEGRGRRDDVEA